MFKSRAFLSCPKFFLAEILCSSKRLKLLMQPLSSISVRTEALLLTKLEVWWYLVVKLGPNLAANFDQVSRVMQQEDKFYLHILWLTQFLGQILSLVQDNMALWPLSLSN